MQIIQSIWFKFWAVIILSIPVLILSFISETEFSFLSRFHFKGEHGFLVTLLSLMYLIIIWTFLTRCINEIRNRLPGIALIIILASTVLEINLLLSIKSSAYKPLFFDMASVIDLLFLNFLLIHSSIENYINADFFKKRIPDSARLKLETEDKIVQSSRLQKDDLVIIGTKEYVPCDGVVVEGESNVLEPVNEYHRKIKKMQRSIVLGGSLCIDGSITIRILNTVKDSYVVKGSDVIRDAISKKTKSQILVEKVGFYLFALTIVISLAQFILSYFFLKSGFTVSIEKTISIIVVTCSHVLYFTVPLCLFVTVGQLAFQGIIVSNIEALEKARLMNVIVFDRTGTLTEEHFGVTDIVVFNQRFTKDEVVKFAASLEKNYPNPIGKAIVEFSEEILPVSDYKVIENQGVSGVVEGKNTKVVNSNYLLEKGIKYDLTRHNEMREGSKMVMYVLIENEIFGSIILSDVIRAEARDLVKKLKKRAIKTIIMTADAKSAAQWIANEMQLDSYIAEVQKKTRESKIKEIQSQGRITGVTGDGIKDEGVLNQADIGFALGSGIQTGAKGDIRFFHRTPIEILQVIKMSQLTHKKINQNVAWILVYFIITIVTVFGVLTRWEIVITPAISAMLALLGTLVVIFNSRLYSHRVLSR